MHVTFWVLVAGEEVAWVNINLNEQELIKTVNKVGVPMCCEEGVGIGRWNGLLGYLKDNIFFTVNHKNKSDFAEMSPLSLKHNAEVLVQWKPSSMKDLARKIIRNLFN
ncbi:uncharacterized protein LOC111701874 [Eurytemora carolleeae]|uniref:uncharacterized protein LOC111701874 n=1 Tax=Eurytemora carolleeae TaxID=1294199 RepID=UPI000C778769|nr:uncharacterized protein LOC111701874 [Eurytemora carolleeae]|eukprot:XP_023329123.1 uncharacterized protein LOC111701874 [Eurytemora affinis]